MWPVSGKLEAIAQAIFTLHTQHKPSSPYTLNTSVFLLNLLLPISINKNTA